MTRILFRRKALSTLPPPPPEPVRCTYADLKEGDWFYSLHAVLDRPRMVLHDGWSVIYWSPENRSGFKMLNRHHPVRKVDKPVWPDTV